MVKHDLFSLVIRYIYRCIIISETNMAHTFAEKIERIKLIEKRRFRDRGLRNTLLGTVLLFVFFWMFR